MFGLFSPFAMNPKFEKEQRERMKKEKAERLTQGIPWDPKMRWQPRLTIKSETWPSWDLFSVEPSKHINVNWEKDTRKLVLSPSGQFVFYRKILPRGKSIACLSGSRRGDIMFDGPIVIPALHEKKGDGWDENPWMSYTPQELLTQRPGIRFAKGHTVIAGLGLGWMLVQVLRKRSVTKVTLVEKSQELVDWLMPAIAPMIRNLGKDMDTIVGDAYEVVPKLTADVALIDIFSHYGSNDFLEDIYLKTRFERPKHRGCPNIGRVWSWGAAHVGDDSQRGWW